MTELDQNLQSVTSGKFVKTERDNLREDNKRLISELNNYKSMVIKVALSKDATIEYLKEMVWGVKEETACRML